MTVGRVETPLPSTAPGFIHVTIDSSGSYKDVPVDQLYSFRLDPHVSWTGDSGSSVQVAPVGRRDSVPSYIFLFWAFVLNSISIFLSLQMIGRIPPPAQPFLAQFEGMATKHGKLTDICTY